MKAQAESAALMYRRRRLNMCFCEKCLAADPARAEMKRTALGNSRLGELRKRRPR